MIHFVAIHIIIELACETWVANSGTLLCPVADTAEIRFFAVRSPPLWVSGYCTKWRIQVSSFHSSYSRLLNVKTAPKTQYLASILSDTFVKCIYHNISCALGKWSLHSRWNFISTFAKLHVHGDERWPTEVTSNTYFRGALWSLFMNRELTLSTCALFVYADPVTEKKTSDRSRSVTIILIAAVIGFVVLAIIIVVIVIVFVRKWVSPAG